MSSTTRTKVRCDGSTIEWEPVWRHDEGGYLESEYPWKEALPCSGDPCTCEPVDDAEPSTHFLEHHGDILDFDVNCTKCDYNLLKAFMEPIAENFMQESPILKYVKGRQSGT